MPTDIPESYDFTTYLLAKKSVDERALNRQVWQCLQTGFAPGSQEKPQLVLEVGCGIGAMLERMLDWDLLRYANYLGLDTREDNISLARQQVKYWAGQHGWRVQDGAASLVLDQPGRNVTVRFEVIDVFDFISARTAGATGFDLLVGHAFLDLLDIPTALPRLLGLLQSGGWFYFPITFDGLTLLEPSGNPYLDEAVLRAYHSSMDERQTGGKPSGDSQAGRHLFQNLQNNKAKIEAAGSSDWVVFPTQGVYPANEAYFLHTILHFMETSLTGRRDVDPQSLKSWLANRHEQIRRGQLVFIAHQLDFCGRISQMGKIAL